VLIENSFEVPASVDVAWGLLLDVPRVIPCMPGAELLEVVSEDEWKAQVKVKFGAVALTFVSNVTQTALDEQGHEVTLVAKAREKRARGSADVTIRSKLTATDDITTVAVTADLRLSGTVAQYGGGLIEDVSSQMVGRFAANLRAELENNDATSEPALAATNGATPSSESSPGALGAAPSATTAATPRPERPAQRPAAKPVGGFGLMLSVLWKRLRRLTRAKSIA
jgi:uncharacterized protein